ncbi:MAG: hypothetical protein NWR72_16290, partial [Bacteroidia bacterium]|nr:hypothetical protein [Bacteroidia bacterium]
MRLRFLFALLILMAGVTEELQAQRRNGPNYSLQVGGQFRFLRPIGMNYALEQFNLNNDAWSTKLEDIRWTSGLSVGAGIHRGRSEIRFQVQTFGASTFGVGPDSTAAVVRRDVRLSGATYQIGLASNLVEINRNLSFGVGGTFSINRIVLQTDAVAETAFMDGATLPTVQTQLKPSLNLIAPINIGLGPWIGVKIEPTYQVFFAPTNYSDFSQAINGNAVSATDPSLETEADHFGITVSVVGYLFR